MIPRPAFLSLFATLLLVQFACFPNAAFAFSENEGFTSSEPYSIYDLNLDSNQCVAGTPCDDGDPCTENDVCDGNGNCVGTPKVCDDGNLNTIDTCDENGNCVFTPLPAGTPCNDGNLCTTGDVADGLGGCSGTEIVCDDGNPCTTDICDPVFGCIFIPNAAGTPCDDGDSCTENDVCDGNGNCVGTPIVCPPSTDPCFVNECVPGIGCTLVPAPAGTPCDDGDPCTENDVCDGNGNCVGTPKVCDDGNLNTIDTCDGNGDCVFTPLPAGTPCNDGNLCTTGDVADGLGGCSGTAIVCDDGNPCTTDICDPVVGCIFIPNAAGTPCDDGDSCTENDVCDGNGNCVGTPIVCPPSTDPCFVNECVPGIGCTLVPAPAGTPCDDGDPCTENDVCDGNGNCVGTPKVCDDGNLNTIDTCDGNGDCVFTPLPAGTPCNDGNLCTTGDVADGLGGCSGTAIVCDDGNPCTTDICDPVLGCVFILNEVGTPCDDGDPNTIGTTIQPDCTCGGGTTTPACSNPFPAVEEASLLTLTGPSSIVTAWGAVPGQIGCQIQVRFAGGSILGAQIVGGANADGFNIPFGVLQPGTDYQWRVRCGCSQNPLVAGPFSSWQSFSTASGVSMVSNPNPTTGVSNVTFSVAEPDRVTLEVYDMNGRLIDAIYHGAVSADTEYRVEFDGNDLPNGIYIYRLTTNNEVINRRFMIAK